MEMLCSGCEAYADLMRNSNNAMLRKERKDAGADENSKKMRRARRPCPSAALSKSTKEANVEVLFDTTPRDA